ncbi:MAG: hypothetical protein E4H14_10350 [Candidatus Thorarchaeota archaeon]|nr:MAG: hypothetical protein E4H14_10350 [Candidatus Thorarchaeota archaeon]
MVRVPYEDNKFVGSSVILLVVMGFIMPISIATIFGFSPQVVQGPPSINSPQEGVTILPPPHYLTIGNGTIFDSLVNETMDPVALTSEAPVVVGDTIIVTTAYPSSNISINESEAIDIAGNFIMSFVYMQGITLDLTAFLSERMPYWIVNSQVEGGSVCVWINALSGIVCFYSVDVDLRLVEDTDLRLYFSGPGNISLEEAETSAFDFLQQNNYTLENGSRYHNPWFRPLPPGDISEGFVNGYYGFHISGMHEGILERDNTVQFQIEASTGAVVHFSYLWTEHPGLPEVDIVDLDVAENSAIDYLHDRGITWPTIGNPILVLHANWFPDIGYSGSIYWQIAVEGEAINQLHISPISGEVLGYDGTITVVTATGTTGTRAPPAFGALMPLGIVFILPLSSFSLGLAGYIIVKNRQTRRIVGRKEE